MKSIAWLYVIFSLVIAALGVFLIYYASDIMTAAPRLYQGEATGKTGPFLFSLFGGLAILAFWIWFMRRIREEGGEEGMPLIEFRPREPKTRKVKKGHR